MTRMRVTVQEWLGEEEGASLVEYVWLVTLVSLAAFVAVTLFGQELKSNFDNSASNIAMEVPAVADPPEINVEVLEQLWEDVDNRCTDG